MSAEARSPAATSLPRRTLLTGGVGLASAGLVGVSGCSIIQGTTVATDFFATVTDVAEVPVPGDVVLSDDYSYLVTPGIGFVITSITWHPSLPVRLTRALAGDHRSRLVAPDGHSFLLVGLEAIDPAFSDSEVPPVRVAIGERHHDVGALFGTWSADTGGWEHPAGGFCVCVPHGAPVLLEVATQGRTARLNLRTGVRTGDEDTIAHEGLFNPPDVTPPTAPTVWHATLLSEPGPGKQRETGRLTLTWTFDPERTWVSPFAHRWAITGHHWFSLGIRSSAAWSGKTFNLMGTAAESMTFVDPTGKRYEGDIDEIDLWAPPESWSVLFEVPLEVWAGHVEVSFQDKATTKSHNFIVPARFLSRDRDMVVPLRVT